MTRVLLDEDLPVRLRHHFPTEVEVETVEYRDWKGLENGDLLTAAAEMFDALVTMDDNLPHQQNLSKYDIAVIILRARSKRMADLVPLMPELAGHLDDLRPGSVIRVYPPDHES